MTLQPLWWDGVDVAAGTGTAGTGTPKPPLAADTDVDVCVIGAGYTGLWTAYYLLVADPSLTVMVLEAEHVGFGASGRNGGWVSALYPVGPATLARGHGDQAARNQHAALRESVDEVGRVAAAEGIDAGFRKGGTIVLARTAAQEVRARAEVEESRAWGTGTVWLDAGAARERLSAQGTRGATYNPNCARVHPYRLVAGIAGAVESRGGRIHEGTRVTAIHPRRVETERGAVVRARHVVRAVEAWTPRLPTLHRAIAPVYSLIVATEPLSADRWSQIGLDEAETFSEHRHVIVYGQRSVDDRLVFGGRGAPYHFGSGVRPEFDSDTGVFEALRSSLREMLPGAAGARFTHSWGGPLGISRDWHPSVGLDPHTGIGWAGGYVGDGVATSNLAGRTLAELIAGRATTLTALPWVGHRSRSWEPEPLRWLGINAGLRLAGLADQEERVTHRPAVLGKALSALTGH